MIPKKGGVKKRKENLGEKEGEEIKQKNSRLIQVFFQIRIFIF